jgi:hypothetical protein
MEPKCFSWMQEYYFQLSDSSLVIFLADYLNPGHDQYVYRHPNG